jgi:hypothetical protein
MSSIGLHVIHPPKHSRHSQLKYGLTLAAIALVTFLGYVGLVVFLKQIDSAFGLYSLYFVAIIAGVDTFFSPC